MSGIESISSADLTKRLRSQRDEARACLSDLLKESEEIVGEFERLKRTYEPPYVAYASWAKPAAIRLLKWEPRA